jgi:SAM-dependent methyltransferase
MPEDWFGEQVAARYDESSADLFEPAVVDPVVGFLAGLAGHGAALELGVGTGRIALPLARRGIRVHGIDLSDAMVARLRAKPGAEQVGVTIGDFATATVDGRFSVAYLVFNTIMNLTTQDEQVACFQNVAAHLQPGGHFVIEVMVPALQRLPPGETVRAFDLTPTHLGFDEYDVVGQGLISHHYAVADGKLEVVSMPFRYVWPSELDLMARLAGMTLRERWSGWGREPFTRDSTNHVSVWEKTASRHGSALLQRQPGPEPDEHDPAHPVEHPSDPRPPQHRPGPVDGHAVQGQPAERHQAEHQPQPHQPDRARPRRRELRQQAEEERRHLGVRQVAHHPLPQPPPHLAGRPTRPAGHAPTP